MATITVDVEYDLSDVDEQDLVDELGSRGYSCVENTFSGQNLDHIDLDRISHLVWCGQKQAALVELTQMVESSIGCRLN